MPEIESSPTLPSQASQVVDSIFDDFESMGLLDQNEMFCGKMVQAHNMVRPKDFKIKGENDYGEFLAFIGECCTYHNIWVKNPKRGSKDKIYIPDEKVEEVEKLAWKHLGSQIEVYRHGPKKRAIINVVSLPVPSGQTDTTGMEKVVKALDLDVYFLQKFIVNHELFQELIHGKAAIEYWKQERTDGDSPKFALPKVKFWRDKGLTLEEREFYAKEEFALDSYIRSKLYSSLDNWDAHFASIEAHLIEQAKSN